MLKFPMFGIFIPLLLVSPLRAADCEDVIARHTVGEAMLAAQFVAAAEWNSMTPGEINAALGVPLWHHAPKKLQLLSDNSTQLALSYGVRDALGANLRRPTTTADR